jgi:hypothetical protein
LKSNPKFKFEVRNGLLTISIGGVPEDSAEEMLSEKGQATHPILDCFQRFSENKH